MTIKACEQIVNCLVQQILKPSTQTTANNSTFNANTTTNVNSCLLTLFLFCKSYPKLLVPHGTTLSPYLSSKINSQNDTHVTQNVCKILELIVPLMDHPNPKFLAELEEDSMKLMLKQSQIVVQCSASCLASIINNVTHNFNFVVDAFNKFYSKFKDCLSMLSSLSIWARLVKQSLFLKSSKSPHAGFWTKYSFQNSRASLVCLH